MRKYTGTRVEGSENVSILYRAIWNVTSDKRLEVAMKILKHDTSDKYMKDFIHLAGQWAFLQTTSIVRLYGITLRSPVAMIMEYLRYGPLDVYLREKRRSIQAVDLVEAASSLATALWHMSESGVVHGNIRCRKMMVASHDSSHFSVKLCDPGLHSSYADHEIHWIPIEYLNNMDLARLSPNADVWAFATTIWEIFYYGVSPAEINPTFTKKSYIGGNRLPMPPGCPGELCEVIKCCWLRDQYRRARPQVIMRDVNHLLYQVFNSRRTHSYATVFPKSFKEGSACSLQSNLTGESCLDSNLLSASDIEQDSMRSISSSFSGGHTTMTDDFDYSRDDDISSCDLSTIFTNLQFSTHLNSMDSVDSMQCIFELGADCNVVLQGRIGQGFYGEVYKGTLERNDDTEPIQVAIKKLKTTAQNSQQQEDFEREISIMRTLKHHNIVEILGVLEEPEIQLIMEYVQHGSLQCYLKIHRHTITAKQLLTYALDVAMGMEYLGTKHVVHRDLAARNILVVAEDHVKISDFGLAQVMNKGDYYILKTNRDLPLKWYAPESVSDGKFSSRSDVWSYGVTLWEMFSFGEEPPAWGPSISPDRLSKLACPAFCPPEVYARLVLICWQFVPTDRPTFSQLTSICRDLLTQF